MVCTCWRWWFSSSRYDRWLFEIDNLDDEELAAALAEFPDLLDWRAGR